MSKKIEKSNTKFEDDLKRLEEIVKELESGLPIEDALKYYEEGIKLCDKLEKKLSDIETKVYEVKNLKQLAKRVDSDVDLELFK